MVLKTERLILRRWQHSDIEPFAKLNSDPRVMEFFPTTLTKQESGELITIIETRMAQQGFGFWAAELKESRAFIGFIGLNVPGYPLPFAPCVEIGWRLDLPYWGRGYAQEGARACLKYGFESLGLKEIVSFTAQTNLRSRHVMERIGMIRDLTGDFDSPRIPEGNPLKRHVLYRIAKP